MAEAVAAGARECCGLLLSSGGSGRIDAWRAARNVALRPQSHFEVDPHSLLAAHRAQRAGGPRIAGCYHSHPGGDPAPSPTDARQAAADGAVWIICTGDGLRAAAWIARDKGCVHDRFDPVEMIAD